jgi:hypothetical protein
MRILEDVPVPYDVFISYASPDKTVADAVCARLESAGIRCWIAPRDVVAGRPYGEAIIDAIREAKVMVLVFSSNANLSDHIPKEVERAVSNGVAILPFRIQNVAPGKSLDYFIGSVHWLDALTPPMEKHLDNLAATVHKLLPATIGAHRMPPAQPTVMWQRGAPGVASTGAAVGGSGAAPSSGTHSSSSSKTILIALAAMVVLAAVVLGVMLLRGAGNSQSTPDLLATGPDPIVGCYQWSNGAAVVIRPDHTMAAGPFTASWQLTNRSQRAYTFIWSQPVTAKVTLSRDQRSLSGGNQYGFTLSATRTAGSGGLVGTWNWFDVAPSTVTVNPDGTFSAVSSHGTDGGTWRLADTSGETYLMTLSDTPTDSVALSGDGSRFSGGDQYGNTISGVRTEPCSIN